MRLNPLCEWEGGCYERATEIDHAIPRDAGGSDAVSNLVAYCRRHHAAKTKQDVA